MDKAPMDDLIVRTGDMRMTSMRDNVSGISTFHLNSDLVVTAFNPSTKSIGMARACDAETVRGFINDMIAAMTGDYMPPLQVRIIGGRDTPACHANLEKIIEAIRMADAGRDLVNLVACDANDRPHPESFRILSFSGRTVATS